MSAWLGTRDVVGRVDEVMARFDHLVTSASARWAAPRPRYGRLPIIAVVVVAAVLRLVDLGRVGLNSDEAVYAGQAASLAGNPHFLPHFPIVRAHPLLMQLIMSLLYGHGVPDTAGRYVAALFGVATVALVYVLGSILFGARVGLVAAGLLAVMPYHVIVSRQIILDGPMTFFATAALTCIAIAADGGARARWLIAAGGFIGCAALTKETAFTLIGAAFVFLSLVNHLWRPLRFPLAGAVAAVTITIVYPVLTAIAGGTGRGQSYLLWQLTRQPNHDFGFYPIVVGGSMGFGALLVAGAGLLLPRVTGRVFAWREVLLLSWILVPLMFFQVWPVKGFSYLMPLTPAIAILAARALVPLPRGLASHRRRVAGAAVAALTIGSLLVPAIDAVVHPSGSGLAGAGGIRGGREAGQWVDGHIPLGARLITIGPSMANIIEYYSGRRCDGLSVSPNPLHRNPSYSSIDNADADLRDGNYQYIVWDVYSAQRSPHFTARADELIHRFSGRPVYVGRDGHAGRKLIEIFQVTP